VNNEQEIAKKIVAVLEANVDSIDAAVAARLQNARQKAVSSMTEHQHAVVELPVLAGFGRVADFSHHAGFRFWLPVLLLLAVLMAMLGSMAVRNSEPIDTDALLLASDLPPEAFADKEFVAWLENTSHL
jgi:hypothetical protein